MNVTIWKNEQSYTSNVHFYRQTIDNVSWKSAKSRVVVFFYAKDDQHAGAIIV